MKTEILWLRSAALALIVTCLGCESGSTYGCEQACEEVVGQCDFVPDSVTVGDCKADCKRMAPVIDASGCKDLYDESLACQSGLDDVCASIADCNTENSDFVSCYAEYCSQAPGNCD